MVVGGRAFEGSATARMLGIGHSIAYVVGAVALGIGLRRRTAGRCGRRRSVARPWPIALPIGVACWLVGAAVEPASPASSPRSSVAGLGVAGPGPVPWSGCASSAARPLPSGRDGAAPVISSRPTPPWSLMGEARPSCARGCSPWWRRLATAAAGPPPRRRRSRAAPVGSWSSRCRTCRGPTSRTGRHPEPRPVRPRRSAVPASRPGCTTGRPRSATAYATHSGPVPGRWRSDGPAAGRGLMVRRAVRAATAGEAYRQRTGVRPTGRSSRPGSSGSSGRMPGCTTTPRWGGAGRGARRRGVGRAVIANADGRGARRGALVTRRDPAPGPSAPRCPRPDGHDGQVRTGRLDPGAPRRDPAAPFVSVWTAPR